MSFRIIPIYDLVPDVANKLGAKKRGLLGPKTIGKVSTPVKSLKEIGLAVQTTMAAIENVDLEKAIWKKLQKTATKYPPSANTPSSQH